MVEFKTIPSSEFWNLEMQFLQAVSPTIGEFLKGVKTFEIVQISEKLLYGLDPQKVGTFFSKSSFPFLSAGQKGHSSLVSSACSQFSVRQHPLGILLSIDYHQYILTEIS